MQNIDSSLLIRQSKSKSFNFLELDSRLNTKKIQQTKKEERQNNLLSLFSKKLKNTELINQCNKALQSYKDHYNINRRFSLFYEEKKQHSQTSQIKNQSKKLNKKLPSLPLLKLSIGKTDQNFLNAITLSLSNTQRVVESQKQQINKTSPQTSILRKKYLKSLFRQNILLIIHKLKLMKISFSQMLDTKIFDKKIPYKFGDKIFHAIKEGNESKVFRIMIQNRLCIFSFDITQKTTLIWACIRGYSKVAELLLSNGVQPHSKDMNGRSALYYAIKYDHLQCAKILFIYAYHIQEELQKQNMSSQMRKVFRTGSQVHKFLKQINNNQKKKEHFEHEYRYYFKM